MDLPKISFAFPVFNEEKNIERCLKSIRNQNYPQELVEIVIADGGSTDRTIEKAKLYNCKIINNPRKLAEPGAVLAHKESTGDIKVFFAADNVLARRDWIRKMVTPFVEDETIYGSYTNIESSGKDNSFNRYYSLLHVEPFTWFIYQNAADPKMFGEYYNVKEKNKGYVIYRFSAMQHPLLAFAQGFCIRKEYKREENYEYDDIIPVIQMIEEDYKLAYVPNAGLYHYHIEGFWQYIKKFQWRIRNSLKSTNSGFMSREKYMSNIRKLRKYLWLLYGCTFVGPIIDSLKWFVRDRNKCWFWHIPASVGLSYLIVIEVLRNRIFALK